MSFLGARLATRRRARGMSRAEVGALVGAGRTAAEIAAFETGTAVPSPVIALELAERVGCEVSALFDSQDDPLLRRALAAHDHIRAVTASAPPISDAGIDRLRHLLPPVAPSASRKAQSA